MDAVLRRAERMIAYQNIQFILAHQNDTLEQLTAYLSDLIPGSTQCAVSSLAEWPRRRPCLRLPSGRS